MKRAAPGSLVIIIGVTASASFFHSSSNPNGEMNWIKVDKEIFDHVGKRISGVLIVPRWRGKYFDSKVFTN